MQAFHNDSDEDDGDIIPAPYHQSTISDNDNRVNAYNFDDIDDTDYNIDSESPIVSTTATDNYDDNDSAGASNVNINTYNDSASNVNINTGNTGSTNDNASNDSNISNSLDMDSATTINRNAIANYITTQWQVLGAKQAEKNASIMQQMQAQSMQPAATNQNNANASNANNQQVQTISYTNPVYSQSQLTTDTNSESGEPVMPTSANMQSNQQYSYNQTESQQYDDNQTQQFYEDNVNIGLDGDAYMNAIQNPDDDEQSELIVDTANKDAGYDWLNGGKDKKNRMKRKIHAYLKMSIIIGLTVIIIFGAIILGKSSMPDYDGFNHQQEIENQKRIDQDKKQHTNNASYSQQNPIITKV